MVNTERNIMITVTKEQFFNFIKSQPDNRELNFSESTTKESCGCPMIHYAKEFFKEHEPVFALTSCWVKEGYVEFAKFNREITLYSFYCNAVNYGQLKAHLYKVHPDFDWN
jgi:hypothetical protein